MQRNYYLVSLIIPTFNRNNLVKEAVQSALAQDYPNIEIIVVDDGSTDGTSEDLLKMFGGSIRVIYQKNAGESHARNRGIIEAKGELLCFLDSDDLLTPCSIAARAGCFFADEKCRVSYGLSLKEKLYSKQKETFKKLNYPSGYILNDYLERSFCNNNSYMISKKDMLAYGMYREDLANFVDMELFVRLTHKLYFCYCYAICALERNKGRRARNIYENIIAQGTKHLDYIFSNPELGKELAAKKNHLYTNVFEEMATASYRLKRGSDFRMYLRRAVELEPKLRKNFKYWKRWALSRLMNKDEK